MLKLLAAQFFREEIHLIFPETGEIVQAIIHPCAIRFILAAIQHDETGISPVEGAVSLIAYIIEQAVQAYRIGIPDLVIAAHKEDRYAVTLYAFGQFADKGCCLIVIGGVVYTIAVEHYKIIVNPLSVRTMPETSSIVYAGR